MDDAGRRSDGDAGRGESGRGRRGLNGGCRGARWSRAASPRRSLSRLIVRSNEVEGTLVAGSNEKQEARTAISDARRLPAGVSNAPTPRNDATASAMLSMRSTSISTSLRESSLALDRLGQPVLTSARELTVQNPSSPPYRRDRWTPSPSGFPSAFSEIPPYPPRVSSRGRGRVAIQARPYPASYSPRPVSRHDGESTRRLRYGFHPPAGSLAYLAC